MEQRIETAGGGYGCGGGYGGDGILGMIALLSLFRNNFYGGDYNAAGSNISEITGQLANIRADIGDVKYDTVSSILSQTNALMSDMCTGRMENISAIMNQTNQLQTELFGLQNTINGVGADLSAQLCAGFNNTNQNILTQGYEGRIAALQNANALSRQMADCCCDTNMNIERTSSATQLRDLEYKADTDKQLVEIKCLIKDTAKDQEIERLKRAEMQGFIANQTNRGMNATIGHWSADAQFNGVTYPPAPFPWAASF